MVLFLVGLCLLLIGFIAILCAVIVTLLIRTECEFEPDFDRELI